MMRRPILILNKVDDQDMLAVRARLSMLHTMLQSFQADTTCHPNYRRWSSPENSEQTIDLIIGNHGHRYLKASSCAQHEAFEFRESWSSFQDLRPQDDGLTIAFDAIAAWRRYLRLPRHRFLAKSNPVEDACNKIFMALAALYTLESRQREIITIVPPSLDVKGRIQQPGRPNSKVTSPEIEAALLKTIPASFAITSPEPRVLEARPTIAFSSELPELNTIEVMRALSILPPELAVPTPHKRRGTKS